MATILISGGTGLVGTALSELLTEKGHQVIILSREKKESTGNIQYAVWDIDKQTIDAKAIAESDCIVHLAGAGIADKRWTDARKREIADSRTNSSALLVKALKELPNNVHTVISASAIGWYGSDDRLANGQQKFTEEMPAATDFLGKTCRLWEESISPIEDNNTRLVKLRFGIVLSTEGGALEQFVKPVKFGLASILGSGKQMISWIHIHDLCRIILAAIENEELHGVYNAVAPAPISNADLMVAIAEKLKGNFFVKAHVPAFVLKLMLGEMSIEVLKSATVSSKKIQDAGFTFLYPTINAAIDTLV